jgi:hypothetical protein
VKETKSGYGPFGPIWAFEPYRPFGDTMDHLGHIYGHIRRFAYTTSLMSVMQDLLHDLTREVKPLSVQGMPYLRTGRAEVSPNALPYHYCELMDEWMGLGMFCRIVLMRFHSDNWLKKRMCLPIRTGLRSKSIGAKSFRTRWPRSTKIIVPPQPKCTYVVML